MSQPLDLRLLAQFAAVAERESISAAAQALHMSPSPLSRRVRQLESALGVVLLDRDRQRVTLTAAGTQVLEIATELLTHERDAIRRLEHIAAGTARPTRVGFVESAIVSGVLPTALRALLDRRPGTRIDLRCLRSHEQLPMIASGELDIAVVHHSPEHHRGPSALVLRREFVLAVPPDHPLASSTNITSDRLATERWIAVSGSASPHGHEEFRSACSRSGFVPDIACEVEQPHAALELVAAGLGVAIAQDDHGHPGVASLALPESLAFGFELHAVLPAEPVPIARDLFELFVAR